MKKKKYLIALIIFILFILNAYLINIYYIKPYLKPDPDDYTSKNIYVYNLSKKRVMMAIQEKERVSPASLTKIMTTIVALENIKNPNEIAPIDKKTYQEMVAKNSSMAGFFGNEKTTYYDLLYGTILNSGGECANSLAINICGSENKFLELMNEKAKELKLNNTHFTNVEGLDDENHYMSAKDVAKLLEYALQNKEFKKIFTTKNKLSTKTINHRNGILLKSTVLSKLDEYPQNNFKIKGGKSGTTDNAGLCWATLAEKNNQEYIIVVMGSPFKNIKNHGDGQIQDTLKILEDL